MITDLLGLPGMPEGEETSLTHLWLPSAQQQRKLLVTGVLATVLTMAEMYNGSVTRVLRYIKRSPFYIPQSQDLVHNAHCIGFLQILFGADAFDLCRHYLQMLIASKIL